MKKTKYVSYTLALLATVAVSATGCKKNPGGKVDSPIVNPFDYATTQSKSITFGVLDMQSTPLSGVTMSAYLTNPVNPIDGTLVEAIDPIHTGSTDISGSLNMLVTLPTESEYLYYIVHSTGFSNPDSVKIDIGSTFNQTVTPVGYTRVAAALSPYAAYDAVITPPVLLSGNLYKMGDWNSLGVPLYKMPVRDVITASMRENIAGAVPEFFSVMKTHPEYFVNPTKANINIVEDAQLWVTFVTEGAGYTSSMGYFTYPTGNPPTSVNDIKRRYIIIPNCSFLNSGGGMVEGDKVQLLYYDEVNNQYTERFPTGTSVGWFLISNGFQNNKITSGLWTMYSIMGLNPGGYQQTLALNDPDNKLMYITFEDISLTSSSDRDFNDVVFYTTASPYTAIEQEGVPLVSKPVDTDKDGVPDAYDEYPTDPTLAYNSYYPGKNVYGTIAYEDLWPATGDYDFNDLVVDLNIHQALNAGNKVVYLEPNVRLRAIGASYHNGFVLGLGCSSASVTSVTGQRLTGNVFQTAASGVESGMSHAIIPVFADGYAIFGNKPYTNTVPGQPTMAPVDMNMRINFATPLDQSTLGSAPFDPFMVIAGERTREVHLVNKAPTSKADQSLISSGSDASNKSKGIYYVSKDGHPWAISLPVSFAYPSEKNGIGKAYKHFDAWATSAGTTYKDWYTAKSGYLNTGLIY